MSETTLPNKKGKSLLDKHRFLRKGHILVLVKILGQFRTYSVSYWDKWYCFFLPDIYAIYFSIFWGTTVQRLRSLKNVNFIVCKIVIARVRSVKILLLLVKQMLGRGHT